MVEFEIERASDVSIELYSVHGRRVCTLANDHYDAGRHSLKWDGIGADGKRVPSGVYFYRIRAGGREEYRKITVE